MAQLHNQDIADVLAQLDNIIHQAKVGEHRYGYFPALYRRVTAAVDDAVKAGEFDDNARMVRFDVVFAGRYLDAFASWQNGELPTASWQQAFAASERWWPIVLQHLLLGINAHINLDLGIAAARIAPGEQIHALKADFDRINQLLAGLVNDVKADLTETWPPLALVDKLAGSLEDGIINFSIGKARDFAWQVALELAAIPIEQQAPRIAQLDQQVADMAGVIQRPGLVVGPAILAWIRLRERGSVAEIIDRLAT